MPLSRSTIDAITQKLHSESLTLPAAPIRVLARSIEEVLSPLMTYHAFQCFSMQSLLTQYLEDARHWKSQCDSANATGLPPSSRLVGFILNGGPEVLHAFERIQSRIKPLPTMKEVSLKQGWQAAGKLMLADAMHFVPGTPPQQLKDGLETAISSSVSKLPELSRLVVSTQNDLLQYAGMTHLKDTLASTAYQQRSY